MHLGANARYYCKVAIRGGRGIGWFAAGDEERLCVVALTSIGQGTQFFPLASYFLV